jgi:hypothetical protein
MQELTGFAAARSVPNGHSQHIVIEVGAAGTGFAEPVGQPDVLWPDRRVGLADFWFLL